MLIQQAVGLRSGAVVMSVAGEVSWDLFLSLWCRLEGDDEDGDVGVRGSGSTWEECGIVNVLGTLLSKGWEAEGGSDPCKPALSIHTN